jgi:hypothetical protein
VITKTNCGNRGEKASGQGNTVREKTKMGDIIAKSVSLSKAAKVQIQFDILNL